MCARADGGGPVQALCLVGIGTHKGKYTSGRMSCESWKSGHFGAIDEPPDYGEEVRRAYESEELGELRESMR